MPEIQTTLKAKPFDGKGNQINLLPQQTLTPEQQAQIAYAQPCMDTLQQCIKRLTDMAEGRGKYSLEIWINPKEKGKAGVGETRVELTSLNSHESNCTAETGAFVGLLKGLFAASPATKGHVHVSSESSHSLFGSSITFDSLEDLVKTLNAATRDPSKKITYEKAGAAR